jgi:hypothetical protein
VAPKQLEFKLTLLKEKFPLCRIRSRRAAPAGESARFASMSRPEIIKTEKQSRQLERSAKTGIEN